MIAVQTVLAPLENHALLVLVSLAIWASIVLGAAWIATARLRGGSPALRYCIWQFALTGLLIVPLLFAALPGIPLGLALPETTSARDLAKPQYRMNADSSTDGLRLHVAHDDHTLLGSTDFRQPSSDRNHADRVADSRQPVSSLPAVAATKPIVSAGNSPAIAPVGSSNALAAWPALLLWLWIAGAAIQATRLIWSAAGAWQLARSARPLGDERFQRTLDELRPLVARRRQPRLFATERVCLPVVVGAVFPKILLPADCREWTAERIRMVLAHELAHVERRDVFWQLLARVAAMIYWFHPMVWLAVRQMRQERERACDDRVLLAGVEATDYASGLVEVVAALRGRRLRMPAAVGMAHSSHFEVRVRSILDGSHKRGPASARFRRAILVATATLVIALGVVRPFSPIRTSAADAPVKQNLAIQNANQKAPAKLPAPAADVPLILDQRGDQITPGVMQVQVFRPDGKPFPNVKLHAGVWTQDEKFKPNRNYKTDAHGKADIVLPHSLYILRLWVDKSGFVSQVIHWEELPCDKRRAVPKHLEVRMQPGMVIGGKVVDEDGKPIPGAGVRVENFPSGTRTFHQWEPAEGDLKTGADGRWKLDNMPPGDLENVRVTPKHPDFISPDDGVDVPFSELREQTAIVRMQRGVRVRGKLIAPDGKPVAGGLAIWGDDPYFENRPQQEVRSDKNGVYSLPPRPVGQLRLTVVAKGWMPEMRMVDVTKADPPQDFHLKPGKTLRVRVVDSAGDLIKPAFLTVREWRGAKSLYTYANPNGALESKLPRQTTTGIFEWTWAPDDAVDYTVSAGEGYSESDTTFTADGKEHVFVLQRTLRIHGQVINAVTGRPVDKFALVPIDDFGNGLFASERHNAQPQHGGIYALEPQQRTDAAIRVRIEAEGYRVAMSPAFRVGDVNTTFDFRLQPAPPLHGRVLVNDRPVKSAKVFLATKSQIYDGWKEDENGFGNNYYVKTNDRGEFALPAQFEHCRLIAVADAGYAETELQPDQQAGDIELQPWAHVDGQLMQAGKPVPFCGVYVGAIEPPRSNDTLRAQDTLGVLTDRRGNFAFDRVPPRKSVIYAQLSPWRDYPITSAEYEPVDLQSGQHLSVDLGGNGISVTGRVAVTGVAKKIDLNWSLNDLLRMKPGVVPPPEIQKLGFDWRQGWNKAWNDTDEGRAYLSTLHHDFVRLGHDGSFLINGVPAGEFQLALRIYKHDDPKACLTEPIAERVVKFTVTPADVAKHGLDLGKIEVEATAAPQPGDAVPDFEFATLDGQSKKLSDFRGKYVLLDFWTTWCSKCVAALPNVHQLQEKYGGDGRFVVVPISLDNDVNALRRFVVDRKLPGVQGSLGDWSKTNLPARLGVSSLPTYLLIGPDGKLIINDWSVNQVAEKLSDLFKSPAAK